MLSPTHNHHKLSIPFSSLAPSLLCFTPFTKQQNKTMADSQDIRYKAGEAKGHVQAKGEQLMDKGRDAAQTMKDKCSSGAQAVKDSANSASNKSAKDSGREVGQQTTSFLQQTGESVKNMAQGAADAVKNTLGMGEGNTTTTTNPSNHPRTNC